MVVKTREGWATNKQIAAQEAAWKRARKSLMAKLGPEATKSAEATKARAAEIFKEMDADSNGSIDSQELKAAFGAVGVELTSKELKAMMHEADRDGDGQIDADEFENRKLSRHLYLPCALCRNPPFGPAADWLAPSVHRPFMYAVLLNEVRRWKQTMFCVVM